MVGHFFWRLGVPLAVLWYLGIVLVCVVSAGAASPREDAVLLLLVIGPIGSAALALLGGMLGFVVAGFSMAYRRKPRR
jgi:hypothetical protein